MSLPFTNRRIVSHTEALTVAVDNWASWKHEHGDKKVLALSALLTRPIAPELVDDLIIDGSLVNSVGVPGSCKSIFAIDLGMSIATGQPTFLGRPLRLEGPAPVLYVLGEGVGRFNLRVMAWQQHHGVAGDEHEFHTYVEPINLLNDNDVEDVRRAVESLGPKLVVFDTLSRCIAGEDENSQAVMSKAVKALDYIKAGSAGCVGLSLHHLNASGTRERGSTALRGGVDTQIALRLPREKEEGEALDAADATIEDAQYVRMSTRAPLGKQKELEEMLKPQTLLKNKVPLIAPDGSPLLDSHGRPLVSLVLTPSHEALRNRVADYLRKNPTASRRKVYANVEGRQEDIRNVLNDLESAK